MWHYLSVPDEESAQPPPVQDWTQPPTQSGGDPSSPMDELIPTKNANALIAYYLAVFSLIPCFGLLLGIGAVILGLKGNKACDLDPKMPGRAHAWVGIILGGFTFLANIAAIFWLIASARSGR